jgi:hypothetical protein
MKKRTKILTLLTTIMLVSGIGATLTSCQDDSAPQNGTLQKTISLSTAFLELNEGETNKLTLDGLKGGETITYLSLNPAVASISADGTVTGLSYGDTIVEVTVGEYTYTCSVRVNAPLTGVLTGYVNVDGSQNGKLNMLPNDEYELNVTAVKGAQPLADGTYTVEWKTDGDGFALTVDETDGSQATIKANAFGAVQVWAEITYLGETVSTDPLSVVSQEIYLLDNGFVNNTITLVGETTVAGNPATKCNTTELNLTYETVVTGETGTIDAKNMDWKVLDETVATIDENGVLKARAEGATKIVGEHEIYGEISMTVDVWNGIEKPEDLDALALITYYNDEEIATKLLSRRYLLTDDIDYSTHVRNFILPIASPAGGLYHYYKTTEGVTDCWDLANGNFTWAAMNTVNVTAHAATAVAHYSLTWKNLLGLTDATETIDGTTVHYLKDADGNEFKGVNPYLVPFTGTLNGNGYSVKNAWLMADNFVFKIPNKDGEINTIGAAACFMGINKGTVTNIGYEIINIPNRNVTYKLTKSDGLNTEMQY